MRAILVERLLWISSLIAVVTGVVEVRRIGALKPHPSAVIVAPRLQAEKLPADSLIEAIDIARDGNLFRADRRYHEPNQVGTTQSVTSVTPALVRPVLVLRGIVGGPDWAAIVEGIPGTDGAAVLRTGRRIGGVSLLAVRRDTAILVGKDTTWKLAVRRVW